MGSRVKFQLENDNLSSNLMGAEEPTREEEYNQLFNECGFIDEIELEPFSSKTLVLNFTPRSKLGLQNSILLQRELMESFLEGKGRQKFFARYSLELFEGYLWLEVVSGFEIRQGDRNSQVDVPFREIYPHSCTPLMIKVTGRLCPSVLLPDTHEIVFDNCSVGETYVRDLNVWNLSEISSSFTFGLKYIDRITLDGKSSYRLTGGNLGHWIYIVDYETGASIEDAIDVAGFSYRRLQVIFRALAEGEINYYFEMENQKDLRNSFTIKISSIVTGDLPKDTLEVLNLSGGLVDFGECYYEDSVARKITIRNVSKQELEISLGSDRDDEVVYEIVNDDDHFSGIGFDSVSDGDMNAYSMRALRKEISETMSSDGSETRKSSALATPDRVATPENPMPLSLLDTSGYQSIDISGRIDELLIPAGQEKSIRVIFTPKRPIQEHTPTTKMFSLRETLCRLMTQTFRLFLRSKSVGSKSISCRAKVCDSVISVEPKEIDLGECDIQSLYHTSAIITNMSELPALISFRYSSKAVFIESQEVTIPTKRSYTLPIHYIPRTITSEYKKQIRIVNRKNRLNDCVISLKASNIDRHRVVFHAKFYELLTETTTNQIDFGVTVVGDPSLRCFRIKNITKSNLTLELRGNSEISVYSVLSKNALYEKVLKGIQSTDYERDERLVWRREAEIYKKKLSLVENLDEYSRKLLSQPVKEESEISSKMEQKSISWEEKSSEQKKDEQSLFDKQQELENRIQHLMELASPSQRTPTYFSDAGAELDYIETQLRAGRELARSLRDGLLVPVKQVTIAPEEEQVFFITFIPDTKKRSLKGKLRPIDSILSIRILQVDGTLPVDCIHSGITDVSQISPREVLLLLKACKSEMELAQKHIHFGHVTVGEQRTKSIVIQNRCEAPLLYVVKKSGSVSSDDLQFDASKVGVVRPYSSKEVFFKFKPTMAGLFQETVFVENLLDSSADASITMKATVHKKSHFHVENLCDSVVISHNRLDSSVGAFVLYNDSDKTRDFLVEFEARDLSSHSFEELPMVAFHVLETRDAEQFLKNLFQEQLASLESCKRFMSKAAPSLSKMKISVRPRGRELILFWISCQQPDKQISHIFGNDFTYKFDLIIFEIKNRDVERRISATCRLSHESDFDSAFALLDSNRTPVEQVDRKDMEEEPLFSIGIQKLDIGGVQVGQMVRRSIRISSLCKDTSLTLEVFAKNNVLNNLCDTSCRVYFACSYENDSSKCELAAEATTEIIIEICPVAVRKFHSVFSILGRSHKDSTAFETSFEVIYFGYSKDSIRILECRDEESLYPFCTVADLSRRFAWIYHLRVVCDVQDCNRAVLNAKSNLPSQIVIYSDTKLETLAENIPIATGIAQELFLCVAPKFSEDDIVNCSAKRIVAGLQLSVSDQDTKTVLSERTWKVHGIVGIVRLEFSLSGSSFWIIDKDNSVESLECHGQLELRNGSSQFSTDFHVVSPYRDVVLNGPIHGILGCSSNGLSLIDCDRDEWKSLVSPEWLESMKYPIHVMISYSFYPQETGYIARKLYMESASFSFPAQVSFGCFVDDGRFQLKSPYLLEADHSLRVPICVRRKSNDTFVPSEAFNFTLSVFDDNNSSDDSDNLIIMSNFICLMSATNKEEALSLNGWNARFYDCYVAKDIVKLNNSFQYIIRHSQSLSLEKDEEYFLRDHGFLERKGFLLLADARIKCQPYNKENFVRKIIACTLYYECPELAVISDNPAYLGDIGPLSGILEKEVTFELENQSQFMVIASLDHIPSGLIPQFPFLKEASHDIVFRPTEKKTISFMLVSEHLDQSIRGKSSLNLLLVNQMNEWNQVKLNIELNYLKAKLQVSDTTILMKSLKYPHGAIVESQLEVTNLSPLDLVLDTVFQPTAEWTSDTMPVELCFINGDNGNVWEPEITLEGRGHCSHLLIRAIPRVDSPWILLEKLKEQNANEDQESILSFIDSGIPLGQLSFTPRRDELSVVSIPILFTFQLDAFVLHSPNKLILEHSSDLKKSISFWNPWTAATFGCRLESVSLPSFLQLRSTLEEFVLKPSSQVDFTLKLIWDLSAITSASYYTSLELDTGHSCVFTISIPDQVFSRLSYEQQQLLVNSSWELENLFQVIIPVELTSSFLHELMDSFAASRQPTSSPVDTVNSRASTPAFGLSEQDIGLEQQWLMEEEVMDSLPCLILRGCSSLPSIIQEVRYALDIGQVFIGREPAPWTFVLETSSPKLALYYRIYVVTMEEDDTCWISLGKQEGLLNELDPMHEIEAYFSAFRMGYFHGYIRIENVSNPSDIIVVSVNMQVVAKLETEEQVKKEVFSVICDGRRRSRQNTIDYSVVFFDHVYRHRSLVITNHSSVEQEFLLKHDLHTENKSELNFSLTNNSLRKVNSLHIRSGESARVFLYYRPALESSDMANLSDITKYDQQEIIRDYHVFIHCRLVKDYQEVILVKSRCRLPRLQVSPVDQVFTMHLYSSESHHSSHGGDWFHTQLVTSTSDTTMALSGGYPKPEEKYASSPGMIPFSLNNEWYAIDPPHCQVTIRNLSPTTPLHYRIMNNAFFFQVENVDETFIIPPTNSIHNNFRGTEWTTENCSSHTITIRVDPKALFQRQKILLKEKYVEEHISIYNCDLPKEFFWIRLRLSVDGTAKNFTAVMHKGTPAFETLEAIAQQFMKQVGKAFHHLHRQLNNQRNMLWQTLNASDTHSASQSGDITDEVCRHMEQILTDWMLEDSHRQLMFQMHYVTDELTYYALKDPSDAALLLAKLVYSFIFRSNIVSLGFGVPGANKRH
ncbi:uncharacterized protein Gasu_29210 [Galdieria sulphuraria]|uniref:Uncharacterized protein n=1 Tax=Galdieria sulphuraria TaxID=130081 RepID=M2X044_GALSU|nr:uncharacterized protein Gasu_29210 [Galdieria sulphuraria]EME29700.1 hypothetical protein Gasu_29210 [Galdieria sulphuraria]|eukprot:XP_005706220.1 hypothetical protein Gasu_29210 [Galdieria sulphuraria]